jgi:hypothetical protein
MFWDAKKLVVPCMVCGEESTVIVVDDAGNDVGPHCGPDADERINTENAPMYKALRESEAQRIAAES